ncbi:MAG: SDR family NAD(P)-dependent oxidoreductase, partial [Bacteroidota bacterium]
MDLGIKERLFLVCGATSGFGRAVAEALLKEDAHIIIVARTAEKVDAFASTHPNIESVVGDITTDVTITEVIRKIGSRTLDGVLINA